MNPELSSLGEQSAKGQEIDLGRGDQIAEVREYEMIEAVR